MDFGRSLLEQEGVTSRSNIRVLPQDNSPGHQASLDDRLLRASNQAALDLFQTTRPQFADASRYPERILPQSSIIQSDDLVVIFESFDNLNFVYAHPEGVFSNRNGHFLHKDFIGKPFGCKLRSHSHRGYGFVYCLKPTPELWVRSLPHRTQVIHELDASMIVYQLWLRPNYTVVESGTGSGALSHAVARTLAPHGHLHTFEFHAARSIKAREEFANHNLTSLVTVHHRDVCGKPSGGGGFGLPQHSSHAVILDLPEPWWAIPHAAFVLKRGGRIACYSPCVEQSQRTILALEKSGFHSITTMEYRLREHYVDVTAWEAPPQTKRPCSVKQEETTATTATIEEEQEATAAEEERETKDGQETTATTIEEVSATEETTVANDNDAATNDDDDDDGSNDEKKRKRMLCARPFSTMRGHSAFLTFATAGNKSQPDPNAAS